MLTYRTNILFDEATWKALVAKAKAEGRSAADLIRSAVKTVYFQNPELEKRKKALDAILKIRPKPQKWDYKALINYGRKY